ncbi:MAG: hypothetical protein LBT49_02715 [Prevotellaceae bacterium]|jgi:hypothetical protein|nr:hypothetical protein [Prevotellaceae bacterium]
MLFMLLACGLSAQTGGGVILSNYKVLAGPDGRSSTLTVDIRWERPANKKVWSDTVWVFADYNNNDNMTRLLLAPGATLANPSWSGAKVIEEPGNNRGVWVVGNARTPESGGSFSATLLLPTATGTANFPGMCVYAVNYPPMAQADPTGTEFAFHGTPPFYLNFADGSTHTLERQAAPHTYTYPAAGARSSTFSDATGAPGKFECFPLVVYDLTASASSYCDNAPQDIVFTLSGTQAGQSYILHRNGVAIEGVLPGTGSPATFTARVDGTGTYTAWSVEQSEYCRTAMRGSIPVVALQTPTTPEITRVSDGTVCQGENITFSVPAPVSGATYTWRGTAGEPSGRANSLYTVSGATAGDKAVSVYARTTKGGITCQSANAEPVTATVVATPATPVIMVSAGTVCQEMDVEFRVANPEAGATYYWSGEAGRPSGKANDTYMVSGATTGNKKVSVYARTAQNGVTCPSLTATSIATVVPKPATPVITALAPTVCLGTDVMFKVSNPAEGRVNYTWFGTAGSPNGTGNGSYTISCAPAGQKEVRVIASITNGVTCESAPSAPATATVVATPSTPVISNNGPVCEGTHLTFMAVGGNGSYEWSGDVANTSGVKVISMENSAGNYTANVLSFVTQDGLTCKSATASTTGTITALSTDGNPSSSCGCAKGTTECSGICRTNRTYTAESTDCSNTCGKAYIKLYNQCGVAIQNTGEYNYRPCRNGCKPELRDPANWLVANAICVAEGNRLPTGVEVCKLVHEFGVVVDVEVWTKGEAIDNTRETMTTGWTECKLKRRESTLNASYFCVTGNP